MKQFERKTLAFVMLLSIFTSCSDDDDNSNTVISVDDAAELVAASMAVATYGAVSNMDYVSDQIVDILDCDESESEIRSDTETSNNGEITVSYTISESYSLACSGGEETISYNFSADQTTTSNPLDTDHSINGDWLITGAEATSTELIYNGSYSRGGEWTYNNEDNHTDTTNTSFVYNNVKANKDDGIIFDGTSTFLLDGMSTVYEPYNYEGNIVFQENNICIATFSTGEQYEIDLNTGEVTPL
ncbi:hypothetical protein [Croceitalea rosinachiae]|uniref:Lipocalin-like domain-containing protein n=1 Tax=Croceitalea rosinachiae TaxID=3075596 RepID=A0ABU3A7V1_9FLAO|nr:hypothetical protein [Croceitalea sp. F388]MDT0605955.1 hypothetical protein [Croceitalea sp. F388]